MTTKRWSRAAPWSGRGRLAVTVLLSICATSIAACDAEAPDPGEESAAERPALEPRESGELGATDDRLLDPNTADRARLASAGVPEPAIDAIVENRPFPDVLALDRVLADLMDATARERVYRVLWIPLELNTASREEILLIPGVGARMAHEFEEYRPYRAMAEFRREIGKYVDDEEVERLSRYVRLDTQP